MIELTFECEIITPMFMYGGDGRTLELRPSEFKGMLRFWWRTLHPNLVHLDEKSQKPNFKKLKEKENEIFGSTEKKSGFRIFVKGDNLEDGEYKALPHQKDEIYNKKKSKIEKNKKAFKLSAFEPNQVFTIKFLFKEKNYYELIKNLFILSTIIGGFGKRSRRGLGSIKINKINEKDFNYETYLSIDKLKELINSINSEFEFNFKDDEVNYPFIKKIEIGDKPYQSYDELLKHIGQMTHDCRCGKSGVFKDVERFASPCYVSVIKKNNKYYPIITSLNIALPNNRNISLSQLISINKFKNSILHKTKEC